MLQPDPLLFSAATWQLTKICRTKQSLMRPTSNSSATIFWTGHRKEDFRAAARAAYVQVPRCSFCKDVRALLFLWSTEVFPRVLLLHIFVEFLSFCESGFCFPCINLSWNKPHKSVRVLELERQVNPRKPIDQEHLFSYLRVSNPKEGYWKNLA